MWYSLFKYQTAIKNIMWYLNNQFLAMIIYVTMIPRDVTNPLNFSCGYCFGQYVGNGTIPCKSGDYCESGQNTCDTNAKCTVTG